MTIQLIKPAREEVRILGKMFYDSSMRAWNTIRLKTEMIREFKTLKEKQAKISYQMLFYQEYKELEKSLRKMKRNNEPPPVLMWFVKEK